MSSVKKEIAKQRRDLLMTTLVLSVGLGVPFIIAYGLPIYIAHDIERASIHHEPGTVTNILMPVSTESSSPGRPVVAVTLDDHQFGSIGTDTPIRVHDRVVVAYRTGKSGWVYVESLKPLH